MSFTNKILTAIILIVFIAGGFYYFNNRSVQPVEEQTETMQNETTEQEQNVPKTAVAAIETNLGNFEVTLNGEAAPKTVANFIKLANEGFYEGLTFHRIVAGFVIQGGDPSGDGTGGPDYTVPAEIGLTHEAGAIAMARTGDAVNPTRASSGSQFYIALQPLEQLDGAYTVFGYVTAGMDVVEAIGSTPTEPNPLTGEASVPLQLVIINKITIK